jgi:hypothetical protein
LSINTRSSFSSEARSRSGSRTGCARQVAVESLGEVRAGGQVLAEHLHFFQLDIDAVAISLRLRSRRLSWWP